MLENHLKVAKVMSTCSYSKDDGLSWLEESLIS